MTTSLTALAKSVCPKMKEIINDTAFQNDVTKSIQRQQLEKLKDLKFVEDVKSINYDIKFKTKKDLGLFNVTYRVYNTTTVEMTDGTTLKFTGLDSLMTDHRIIKKYDRYGNLMSEKLRCAYRNFFITDLRNTHNNRKLDSMYIQNEYVIFPEEYGLTDNTENHLSDNSEREVVKDLSVNETSPDNNDFLESTQE